VPQSLWPMLGHLPHSGNSKTTDLSLCTFKEIVGAREPLSTTPCTSTSTVFHGVTLNGRVLVPKSFFIFSNSAFGMGTSVRFLPKRRSK